MRDKGNYSICVTALNVADLFIYLSILGHPPETINDSLLKLYTMKTQKFFEFILLFLYCVKITAAWTIKSDNYFSILSNTTVRNYYNNNRYARFSLMIFDNFVVRFIYSNFATKIMKKL